MLSDIVPLAFSTSESTPVPTESNTPVFTNCTLHTIRTTTTITLNGITITVDSDILEEFLHTLLKAVVHV